MTIELEVLSMNRVTGQVSLRLADSDGHRQRSFWLGVGGRTVLSVAPEVVLPKPAGAGDFDSAVARDVKELGELRGANQVIRQSAAVDEVAKLAVEKTSRSFMWRAPEVQAVHVQHENIGAAYDFLRANGVAVRIGEQRDIAHSGIILKGWVSRFDFEISFGSWVVVTPGARTLIFSDEEFWATFVGFGRAS